MSIHTDYLFFTTARRQEFVRITDEVAAIVRASGIRDGMALVSAMHITAGVFVNDWEGGLIEEAMGGVGGHGSTDALRRGFLQCDPWQQAGQ